MQTWTVPRRCSIARPGARGPRRTGSSSTSSIVVLDPVLATRTTAAGLRRARSGLRRRSVPRRRRGPHRPALRRELGPRPRGVGRDRARHRDGGRGQAAARPGRHHRGRRRPADEPPGAVRRRRRQPAVPQPAGQHDHAPGPLGARRRPVRRCRRGVPGPGPPPGPARRRARRARPATVAAREPRRCRRPPRRAPVLGRLDGLWWSAGEMVFDAQVHTVAAAFVLGERQRSVRRWRGQACHELAPVDGTGLDRRPTWSHLLADAAGIPVVEARTDGVLADWATATAGFRDQFYGLIPFVARRAGRRAARHVRAARPGPLGVGGASGPLRRSPLPPPERRPGRPRAADARLGGLDRGSPGAQGAAGHPDRRPGGSGRRAGHLGAERARGVGGAPHRGRPLADRRRALLAGGLGVGRRHLPRRRARAGDRSS